MLSEMINQNVMATMSKGLNTMNIYRHFKGGYYVVQALATIESTGEEVVIYQSLQDGKVWVRPFSVFFELVPSEKENPTGQKYRFERVVSFDNQLNMVSTENLVKELMSRKDCPVELLKKSDKVWREEYLVGRYVSIASYESDEEAEEFNIYNVYDELNRAIQVVQENPNYSILKRVFIKQDFD